MLNKEFVLKELSRVTHIKNMNRKNLFIVCPFHREKDASLSVSLVDQMSKKGRPIAPGTFRCFGCSAKGGWNVLAAKLGLKQIGKKVRSTGYYNDYGEMIVNINPEIELFSPVKEKDLNLLPMTDNWKSFDPLFLDAFGVKLMWLDSISDFLLYVPVTFIGDYYGHVRLRLSDTTKFPDGKPYPKSWFNLKERMFYPFDYLMNNFFTKVIVLVEGISDVYRLLKEGIPSLATLGTMFNETTCYKCLEGLAVETVIFCFDGDTPGYEAMFGSKKVKGHIFTLDKKGYDVRFVELPRSKNKKDKIDPENMPYQYVKLLKKMIINEGGSLLPSL
jgi:hypothetical protein